MIDTPDEFVRRADAYFAHQEANGRPVTITGLALGVGLSSRQALANYEDRPEFVDVVKAARLRVENAYEERLWEAQCTGAIFALKQMGWSDRQAMELTGKDGKDLNPTVVVLPAKGDGGA